MKPKMNLRDISLNLTNYCLSQCKYCTLWQSKHWELDNEMKIEHIDKNLLSDPMLDDLTTIHITGGSPYLSPKFIPVCKLISKHHSDVPVNSPLEGMFPNLYYKLFKKIIMFLPQYRVDLALEGANRETHNKIRPESWHTVWQTYDLLKNIMPVQFEMTVYPENYKEILDVWNMVDGNLYINFGRFSKRFGNERDGVMNLPEDFIYKIEDQLKETGWLKKRKLNEQKWMLQKALYMGKKVIYDCEFGIKSIDIHPSGRVYPCLMYPTDFSLGSIQNQSITEISQSKRYFTQIKRISDHECIPCPFTCGIWMKNVVAEK